MRPTFFGSSTQPLFGVHHAPLAAARDVGVLLFYPGIQEYGSAHWAMRTLATSLAARGFHALRFDYRGTGDSTGEPTDATVDAWSEDARAAYDELRDVSGVSRVAFVGLRLGAAIAALTSATLSSVDALYLWDPVISGACYLDELELIDATRRLRLLHPRRRRDGELAGYEFPRSVRESIARIDLRRLDPPAGTKIEVFVKRPREDVSALCEAFERRGSPVLVHAPGGANGANRSQSGSSIHAIGHASRQSATLEQEVVAAIVSRIEIA